MRYLRPDSAWFPLHLSPEGDGSGNGEGEGEGGGGGADDAARELFASREGQSAVGKFAHKLWEDNKRVRDRNAALRTENTALKAKVPAEGAVILTGTAATEYQALAAAAVPLKDIPAQLAAGKTAADGLAKLTKKEAAREAAALMEDGAGWDVDVLVDRLERDGLHLEIATSTETVEGQQVTVKVPRVRAAADATVALVDLSTHAETNWKKYLPSLRVDATPDDRQSRPPAPTPTPAPAARRPAPVTRSGETRTPPSASAEQRAEALQGTAPYASF